ncbi:MAG: 5-methylthioadenosine/S-adenosylhomocysteine deaminase [Chloroflexi bacterium ADurb.Bin360]|nr:MAG: 5-methylthioadenosine/S-adenosylhomocysteine deaminase [Chloroflexi bacterium ADurb.Bin360]
METLQTQVDRILTADIVVTMDAQYRIHTPGAIALTGDSIVATGAPEDILSQYAATEVEALGNVIIMPGLVNSHGHTPMTLLRGLADDLRLDVWLMGYMMPVERDFVDPHFSWLGTQLAAAEMIRSGTTTFMDMYYFEEAVADAAAQAGLRGVCAQSILKFPTPDAGSYDEALHRARDYVVRWKGHPLIVPALAPHAPYTVTPELLEAAISLVLEFDVPLHIHIAETAGEVEEHRKEFNMPPVPWLKKIGVFETKATAAHCVHLDEGEILTLLHHNVGIAHNPSSNLKLASGIAPIARMLDLGLNVGIGTDGAASNNDLDMFEEMRLASFLAKVATMNPVTLPARKTLEMATIMGARAMHIDDITGSLEPGKRADLIVVSMDDMRHTPSFKREADSVYSRLVYATHAEDVRHVMVNGRWLMRNRQLLTVDFAAVRAEANALAGKIDNFLSKREESVLSKLVAIGGVAQGKTFEVQVKVRTEDLEAIETKLLSCDEITFTRGSCRKQYDTYMIFNDRWGSVLRYREDEIVDLKTGNFIDVIYRLTLTTKAKEREFENSVLLSRSRFDAAATRSRRFYREYFQPQKEIEVQKERRRFHIRYKGTDFSVNLDRVTMPSGGSFVEIKSRTWSRQDAEHKAALIGELLQLFGISNEALLRSEYVELAEAES